MKEADFNGAVPAIENWSKCRDNANVTEIRRTKALFHRFLRCYNAAKMCIKCVYSAKVISMLARVRCPELSPFSGGINQGSL
jgi:hypothetical protein